MPLPGAASLAGGAAIGAGLDLLVSGLDGEISGADLASAAATGVGTAAGTVAGAALGGLVAGPVGAAVGAQIGGALGGFGASMLARSMFPNRQGPADSYNPTGDPLGGTKAGALYTLTYQRTSVYYTPGGETGSGNSGNVSVNLDGPLRNLRAEMYGDPGQHGGLRNARWLIDSAGSTVTLSTSSKSEGRESVGAVFVDVTEASGDPVKPGNYTPPAVSPVSPNAPSVPVVPPVPNFPVIPAIPTPPGTVPPNLPTGPSSVPPPAKSPGIQPPAAKPPGLTPSGDPTGNPKLAPQSRLDRTKKNNNCGCNKGILNGVGSLFEKYGLDSAQLGLLTTINATTTATNGVAATILTAVMATKGFVETAWKATHMDKVLNALTLMTTLHNAAMISRDVGETMGYVVSNALAVVGIKDEHDNPLNISDMVGNSVTNFIKSVVGQDVYEDTRLLWQKSNRVLQTGSNIIWTLRSIHDTTQDVMEWTAENTGKIGNALKKYGVVYEHAYPWMAEKVRVQDAYRNKLSKVFDNLETAENVASSLAQVTGDIREGIDEVAELGEARQRFSTALTELAGEVSERNGAQKEDSESLEVKIPLDGGKGAEPSDGYLSELADWESKWEPVPEE